MSRQDDLTILHHQPTKHVIAFTYESRTTQPYIITVITSHITITTINYKHPIRDHYRALFRHDSFAVHAFIRWWGGLDHVPPGRRLAPLERLPTSCGWWDRSWTRSWRWLPERVGRGQTDEPMPSSSHCSLRCWRHCLERDHCWAHCQLLARRWEIWKLMNIHRMRFQTSSRKDNFF